MSLSQAPSVTILSRLTYVLLNTLVYSFVDGDALAERLPEIRELLRRMGRTLNQGEFVVEVNDSFYKIRDFDV